MMDTRDPLERAVDRTAALGSIERAYADGYALAQKEIERLRTRESEAVRLINAALSSTRISASRRGSSYAVLYGRRADKGRERMMNIVERLQETTTDKDNMPRMDSERWFPVGLAKEAATEIERLKEGLRMIVSQEYDAGYSPEDYARAVLSGHEPAAGG